MGKIVKEKMVGVRLSEGVYQRFLELLWRERWRSAGDYFRHKIEEDFKRYDEQADPIAAYFARSGNPGPLASGSRGVDRPASLKAIMTPRSGEGPDGPGNALDTKRPESAGPSTSASVSGPSIDEIINQ